MTRIAIVGDYDPNRPAHLATNRAISHVAATLPFKIEADWVSTPSFEDPCNLKELELYQGVWGSAGDPESRHGLINAIMLARVNSLPYLGT